MPHSLAEVTASYLSARQSAGLAHNTLRKERTTLAILNKAAPGVEMNDLSPVHIDAFREMKAETVGASTMNVERNNLVQFIKWAKARGHYPALSDPLQGWAYAKTARRDWLRIPESQFGEVLDAATHPADRFVIALEMFLFLRGTEVQGLIRQNARLNERSMVVLRDKTKQRVALPWDSAFDQELRMWLTYSQLDPMDHLACAKDAMGKLRRGRPVGDTALPVRRALLALGHSKEELEREGGHTLRRSAARAWFDKLEGASGYIHAGRLVQRRLGHATFKQTEAYLGLDFEDRLTEQLLGPEAGPMFDTSPVHPEVVDLSTYRQAQ